MIAVGITLQALRRANSYEVTGRLVSNAPALDDVVLDHVSLTRAMDRLSPEDRVLFRMLAENYTLVEIAKEIGSTVRKVARRIDQLTTLLPAHEKLSLLMTRRSRGLELLACDPRAA